MLKTKTSSFSVVFLLLVIKVLTSRVRQGNTSNGASKCCPEEHTISVSGTGRINLPTNIIKLGFTIETKEKEANGAFMMNSHISSKVDRLLLSEFNVPEKNVSTVNFQMYPKYVSIYHDTNRTTTEYFDGFVVSNQIEVKLTDKNITANLIDRLVTSGVNKINYINFEIDPDMVQQTRKDLMSSAVKDSYEKATILADNSNTKIQDVKSVSINEYYQGSNSVNFSFAAASERAAPSTSIYPGQKEISVTVNIIYLINKS